MKRLLRRSFSILVGLTLGWMAAGLMLSESVTLAEQGHGTAHVEHAEANHGHDHHADAHGHGGHGGHQDDHAADAARLLVPQGSHIAWYGPVLALMGGFFVAAALLGYPVLKMCGQEPPDPAADSSHGDHSH